MTGCVKVDEISPQKLHGCGVEEGADARRKMLPEMIMQLSAGQMAYVISHLNGVLLEPIHKPVTHVHREVMKQAQ